MVAGRRLRDLTRPVKRKRGGGLGLPPSIAARLVARAYGTLIVVPSPVAATVNVPAPAFGVYVYEPPQAGEPPGGGTGTEPMKGPASWFKPLVTWPVRSVSAVGSVPMWAAYMLMAEPRVRVSACAFAMRARV